MSYTNSPTIDIGNNVFGKIVTRRGVNFLKLVKVKCVTNFKRPSDNCIVPTRTAIEISKNQFQQLIKSQNMIITLLDKPCENGKCSCFGYDDDDDFIDASLCQMSFEDTENNDGASCSRINLFAEQPVNNDVASGSRISLLEERLSPSDRQPFKDIQINGLISDISD